MSWVLPVRPLAQRSTSLLHALAALEVQHHAVVEGLDQLALLVVADDAALVAEVVREGVDDLVVEDREQLVAGVDEVHLHPEGAEHRRVLAADDAGAVDGDRPGVSFTRRIVSLSQMRGWPKSTSGGGRAASPVAMTTFADVISSGAVGALDHQGVGVEEAPAAVDHAHAVALVEAVAHGHLRRITPSLGAQQAGSSTW
jgi:hypothetical protein